MIAKGTYHTMPVHRERLVVKKLAIAHAASSAIML